MRTVGQHAARHRVRHREQRVAGRRAFEPFEVKAVDQCRDWSAAGPGTVRRSAVGRLHARTAARARDGRYVELRTRDTDGWILGAGAGKREKAGTECVLREYLRAGSCNTFRFFADGPEQAVKEASRERAFGKELASCGRGSGSRWGAVAESGCELRVSVS